MTTWLLALSIVIFFVIAWMGDAGWIIRGMIIVYSVVAFALLRERRLNKAEKACHPNDREPRTN
jgi:hypothetical protein